MGLSGHGSVRTEVRGWWRGPGFAMTVESATDRDASDQGRQARLWCGIHPPADDIPGRLIGAKMGHSAFALAESLFNGTP